MRCFLHSHEKRKGADKIESVRIRRVTTASEGGEVRVLGREAAAVAAPAGGRVQIGRGAAHQRYGQAEVAGFWPADGEPAADPVFRGCTLVTKQGGQPATELQLGVPKLVV
jgi:hypothetical protein